MSRGHPGFPARSSFFVQDDVILNVFNNMLMTCDVSFVHMHPHNQGEAQSSD